jgi:hypothetical protein
MWRKDLANYANLTLRDPLMLSQRLHHLFELEQALLQLADPGVFLHKLLIQPLDGGQRDMTALSAAEAYQMGDLDGDFDNDIHDFILFRKAYEAENGGGSFAAMVAASAVPEPSSIMLLAAGAAGMGMWRRRRAE